MAREDLLVKELSITDVKELLNALHMTIKEQGIDIELMKKKIMALEAQLDNGVGFDKINWV